MRVKFDINGFEQNNGPQLCISGRTNEYEHFTHILSAYLQQEKIGELKLLESIFDVDENRSVTFIISKSDKFQIENIDETRFSVSGNSEHWKEILALVTPLMYKVGYQFVEFDSGGEIGLLFQSE